MTTVATAGERRYHRAPRPLVAAVVAAMTSLVTACGSGPPESKPLSKVTPVPISAGFDRVTKQVLPRLEWYALGGDANSVLITGSRIIGRRGVNPAFVYDIAGHELLRVDPAPFSPAADAPQTMTVGHHVIVTGISCRDVGDRHADPPIRDCRPGKLVAARFDLVARRWTRLPSPATAVSGSANAYLRPLGAVGELAVFHTPDRVVTFDDRTRRWSTFPMPATPQFPVVCMQRDGTLVAYSNVPRPDDRLGDNVLTSGGELWSAALDAKTWTRVELPPLQFFDEVTARRANDFRIVCGAHGFILADGQLDRVWYQDRTTGQWRDIRPPGPPTAIGDPPYSGVVALADRFYFSGPRWIVFDADDDTWSAFASGPERPFGGVDESTDVVIGRTLYALWADRPVPLALAAWTPHTTGSLAG